MLSLLCNSTCPAINWNRSGLSYMRMCLLGRRKAKRHLLSFRPYLFYHSAHIFVNRAEQFCNAFVGAASSGPRAAGSLSRGAETRACPAQTRTRLFLHGRGRSPAAAVDQFGGRKRRLRRRKKTRGAIRQTRAVPPPSCGRRFLVPDSRFPQKAAEPPAGLYRRTALRRLGLDDCGICRACR